MDASPIWVKTTQGLSFNFPVTFEKTGGRFGRHVRSLSTKWASIDALFMIIASFAGLLGTIGTLASSTRMIRDNLHI
jgi:hypothetical protein